MAEVDSITGYREGTRNLVIACLEEAVSSMEYSFRLYNKKFIKVHGKKEYKDLPSIIGEHYPPDSTYFVFVDDLFGEKIDQIKYEMQNHIEKFDTVQGIYRINKENLKYGLYNIKKHGIYRKPSN